MGIETDQPAGGMSPGGNRRTRPPVRLFLDPFAESQGHGFWTSRVAPSGKRTTSRDENHATRATAFQDRGMDHNVIRHFDQLPEEEEETIKSLTSKEVFSLAKQAMEAGDIPAYQLFKSELEERARVSKALLASAGSAVPRAAPPGPASSNKRVFNATHGVDDETSTEDKDELSIKPPVEKSSRITVHTGKHATYHAVALYPGQKRSPHALSFTPHGKTLSSGISGHHTSLGAMKKIAQAHDATVPKLMAEHAKRTVKKAALVAPKFFLNQMTRKWEPVASAGKTVPPLVVAPKPVTPSHAADQRAKQNLRSPAVAAAATTTRPDGSAATAKVKKPRAKPYGHTAYSRHTGTGKIVNVQARGSKPVEAKKPEAEPKEVEAADPHWKKLVNAGVVLPPPFVPRGIKIAGQKNAVAEEMCLDFAKYLLTEDASKLPDAVALQNFSRDLEKYSGIKVAPTIPAFRKAMALAVVARRKDKEAKAAQPKKAKEEITPKSHPHLFATMDGKSIRPTVLAPSLFVGSVFMGSSTHGERQNRERGSWIPARTFKDITLNGTSFPKDAAKYGSLTTNPNVEWIAKVNFPPESGRKPMTVKLPASSDKVEQKWLETREFSAHHQTITKGVARDLNSSDPVTRERAACLALMEALHIRSGKAGKKEGGVPSIGGTDLTTEHVWLKGNDLLFNFLAKAGEKCRHQDMGVRKLPASAVKVLRELGVGDKPVKGGHRVFARTTPAMLNDWIQAETGVNHLHAHNFRHHHAGLYFMEKWAQVQKKGKPASKAEANKMLGEVTRYVGLKLGHAVQDKKDGPTARKSYIDPKLIQLAMEWMGYDLSNKAEQADKRFTFKKKLLAKSLAWDEKPEPYYAVDDAPPNGYDDLMNALFGDDDEVGKSFALYVDLGVALLLDLQKSKKPCTRCGGTKYNDQRMGVGDCCVNKAIGTKPSEQRERPQKKSKPPPKGKVSSTASGKKNYDYRKPSGAAKKTPTQTPAKGATPGGTPTDQPTLEVKPEKLADLLKLPIESLQALAEKKTLEQFITYMKTKGSTLIAKYKIPDSYFEEIYAVLTKHSVKSFTVDPSKLKKGSEERAFAEAMVTSRVNTLPKLATLLVKGYDLSSKQALGMARELHRSMKAEGALR